MEVNVAVGCHCSLGEGARWDPLENRVYWTDIKKGLLYRLEPEAGRHEQIAVGGHVGGFTFQPDGALLLFAENGAIRVWRARTMETFLDEIPEVRGSRFNDVTTDPEGRVLCGTMPCKDGKSRLYRLDRDGKLTLLLDDLGMANGMGFTPDHKGLYLTDSTPKQIRYYDYDVRDGSLHNGRVFVQLPEGDPVPDGLTMDAEGYVWSAHWGGHCVVRYAPDGRAVQRIDLPVPHVTCLAFGGETYEDLWITTAGGGEEGAPAEAGSLFHARPGVKGRPEFLSRIDVNR